MMITMPKMTVKIMCSISNLYIIKIPAIAAGDAVKALGLRYPPRTVQAQGEDDSEALVVWHG